MTLRPLARSSLFVAATLFAESAQPGVWATDPVLGLVGEYSTNPGLLYIDHTAEAHGAALIDVPTAYHANDVTLSILPSFRISDSRGYSSLASDYAHLTVGGEIDSERNALSFSGQVARDSSLYYTYEVNGATGVRRDTTAADLGWTRSLTERLSSSLDVNTSRVIYGASNGFTSLSDYHYTSAVPSLSWKSSERTTLTMSGTVGVYASSSGETKSTNSNVELGFIRKLSEMWTLTANAGYSRETNKVAEDVFVGYYIEGLYLVPVFAFETFKSSDSGSVFNANLIRHGERLSVTAAATRSVVPTGFAFLASQTSYELHLDYRWTERWTFAGGARRVSSIEPQVQGPTSRQSFWSVGCSAAWQMTEKWLLTLSASKIDSSYRPQNIDVGATGVSVQLSRHFNTIEWH